MAASYEQTIKDRIPRGVENVTRIRHVIDDYADTRRVRVLLLLMIFGEREALLDEPLDVVPVPLVHEELIFLLTSLGAVFLEMSPGRIHHGRWTDDVNRIEDVPAEEFWIRQEGDDEIRLAPAAIGEKHALIGIGGI